MYIYIYITLFKPILKRSLSKPFKALKGPFKGPNQPPRVRGVFADVWEVLWGFFKGIVEGF